MKSIQELRVMLDINIEKIYEMADGATKSAFWKVYKFIHVNTVFLFGTFRTKIRK